MTYCIWNNKGGVGKTLLTFILANAYAQMHTDRYVLVVDMCPQANLSEIMLGGYGRGNIQLNHCIEERKTIGGYFDERILSPNTITGNETAYLIRGKDCNDLLDTNVYFLCGDPSLELQTQVIHQICSQTLPVSVAKNVYAWLKNIIDACVQKLGCDIDVFIDCNPSFSAYTKIALFASDKLLVPCKNDASSVRAFSNVQKLLLTLDKFPLLHSCICIGSGAKCLKNTVTQPCIEIPDDPAIAMLSSHLGMPLSKIEAKMYENFAIEITEKDLDAYTKAIQNLLLLL